MCRRELFIKNVSLCSLRLSFLSYSAFEPFLLRNKWYKLVATNKLSPIRCESTA